MCLSLLLTGCSFLNREYSNVQPHSSAYYESEDRSVLRAESYQDLVNDLLMIIASHAEQGTIWFYPSTETPDVEAAMEKASYETQFETPMGSYAVEYITYDFGEEKGTYQEISLELGYRRTAQQVNDIVHTTSISALYNLLTMAAQSDLPELVVQVSYFRGQKQEVAQIVSQVQEEQAPGSVPWQVSYYPDDSQAGIIEILLSP